MKLTTIPVIDRILAENRLQRGEPLDHPASPAIEDWLDDLQGSIGNLEDVLDEGNLIGTDVRTALDELNGRLQGAPTL